MLIRMLQEGTIGVPIYNRIPLAGRTRAPRVRVRRGMEKLIMTAGETGHSQSDQVATTTVQ